MIVLGDIVEFGKYLKAPGKFSGPINVITKDYPYKDEKKILQGFVHNKAEQKTRYYNKKIAEMKQKYEMDLPAFQNKIYLKPAEINFEEWNDLVLWGGYVKAYGYWAQFC